MSYAEIIFVSAKTGQRLNKIYELVDHIVDAQTMRIPTGVLNEIYKIYRKQNKRILRIQRYIDQIHQQRA